MYSPCILLAGFIQFYLICLPLTNICFSCLIFIHYFLVFTYFKYIYLYLVHTTYIYLYLVHTAYIYLYLVHTTYIYLYLVHTIFLFSTYISAWLLTHYLRERDKLRSLNNGAIAENIFKTKLLVKSIIFSLLYHDIIWLYVFTEH